MKNSKAEQKRKDDLGTYEQISQPRKKSIPDAPRKTSVNPTGDLAGFGDEPLIKPPNIPCPEAPEEIKVPPTDAFEETKRGSKIITRSSIRPTSGQAPVSFLDQIKNKEYNLKKVEPSKNTAFKDLIDNKNLQIKVASTLHAAIVERRNQLTKNAAKNSSDEDEDEDEDT